MSRSYSFDAICKNSNDFSFISTFFDLIGNKQFKESEIQTLYNNECNKDTAVWFALSSVGQTLGSKFNENILNFIDNVCNVDLCKVNQLQSIVKFLNIDYKLLDYIQNIPLDIQNLIDIFSIKREYALNITKMSKDYVSYQLSNNMLDDNTIEDLSSYCTSISKVRQKISDIGDQEYFDNISVQYANSLDDEKFNSYMMSAYYDIILDKITQTYNDINNTVIYENLSDQILISDFALVNECQTSYDEFKKLHNINMSFDVEDETDNVQQNKTSISSYSYNESQLILKEIERRKNAYDNTQLKTRYKYYREKEVQQYALYVQNDYNDSALSNYLNFKQYDIDPLYMEYTISQRKNLFYKDIGGKIAIDISMISCVANNLCKLTKSIRDIREQIKNQTYKNSINGTKLYISFLIREYLKNNVAPNIAKSDYKVDDNKNTVDIVNYVDNTNYNDIIADNDEATGISSANVQYWINANNSLGVKPFDTTNLFAKVHYNQLSTCEFTDNDISALYIDVLKNKFFQYENQTSNQFDQTLDFLNSIYDIGAENTFISDSILQTFDSYSAYKEYASVSIANSTLLSNVEYDFSNLSDFINDELSNGTFKQALNSALSVQLCCLRMNVGQNYSIRHHIDDLSSCLFKSNDIQLCIPITEVYVQLKKKYNKLTSAKEAAYEYSLKTDTFPKYASYRENEFKLCCNVPSMQSKYEQISTYMPQSFEYDNHTLKEQLEILCVSLSAIEDEKERKCALCITESLSDELEEVNELCTKVDIADFSTTLAQKYEIQAAALDNDLKQTYSTETYQYRKKMYENYSADESFPYYYLQNAHHPSFSIHPYVYGLAEAIQTNGQIDNILNTDIADAAEQLKSNIDAIIDDDGYLSNIIYNPILNNTDYISKYEYSGFKNANQSKVAGYDGICYPNALYDFITSAKYRVKSVSVDSTGNEICSISDKEVPFIETLSGETTEYKDSAGTYTYHNSPCNIWYKHLDLNNTQLKFIAEQLSAFEKELKQIANNNSLDIYRYGLDKYQNSYCLVKLSTNGADTISMKNKSGVMWMKIKDHPIAFPLYSFDKADYQQAYIDNSSDTSYKDLQSINLNSSSEFPAYQDFTFSNDKSILVLNGKLKETIGGKEIIASYPKMLDVNYSYNNDLDRYVYSYSSIDTKQDSSIFSQSRIRELSDWTFETYFYDNTLVGAIYSKILHEENNTENDNTYCISAAAAYTTYADDICNVDLGQIPVDSIKLEKNTIDNVCIDANGSIMTIAYVVDRPNKLSDFLSNAVDYDQMSAIIGDEFENLDFAIKTKTYYIDTVNNCLTEQCSCNFTKYTDIGFIGVSSELSISKSKSAIAQLYNDGILCFQLLTKQIEKPINFRYVIPARIRDSAEFTTIKTTTPAGTSFYAAKQNFMHFYEPLNDPSTQHLSSYESLSSDNDRIIDPTVLKSILDGTNPGIKVDESFIQYLNQYDLNKDDPYETYPWLLISCDNSENPPIDLSVISCFLEPYGMTSADNDNCVITLANKSRHTEFNISASWHYYGGIDYVTGKLSDEGMIQLDFNTAYFKENPTETNDLSSNKLNSKHLFLNLEKAGDAGVLKVYIDPLASNYNQLADIYIKNISDYKPKFVLSAYTYTDNNISKFITEDSDPSVFISEKQTGSNNIVLLLEDFII